MKIGLTQRILNHNGILHDLTEHGWYSYLSNHTLFFIRNDVLQDFSNITDEIDCLILTGGSNHLLRTEVENKIILEMIQRNKPIIGFCRGAFVLTELMGGSYVTDTFVHANDRYRHMNNNHTVTYQNEEKIVNSYHNMCINNPPKTSTVLAVDSEGYCEAWIDKNIAAVVWHPERMEVPWLPDEIQILLQRKK